MRRFVLLISAVLVLGACSDYRKVSVGDVSIAEFRFNGTSSATVKVNAEVDNPTRHNFWVDNMDAVLIKEGRDFASFALEGKPEVGPDTVCVVGIPIRVSVLDPIAVITAGLNLESWNLDEFVVNGKITVRSDCGLKKTIRLNKVPLGALLNAIR